MIVILIRHISYVHYFSTPLLQWTDYYSRLGRIEHFAYLNSIRFFEIYLQMSSHWLFLFFFPCLLQDLTLKKGVTVPAGTMLVVPVQLVQMDHFSWGTDASQFNPYRFLSKKGKPSDQSGSVLSRGFILAFFLLSISDLNFLVTTIFWSCSLKYGKWLYIRLSFLNMFGCSCGSSAYMHPINMLFQ